MDQRPDNLPWYAVANAALGVEEATLLRLQVTSPALSSTLPVSGQASSVLLVEFWAVKNDTCCYFTICKKILCKMFQRKNQSGKAILDIWKMEWCPTTLHNELLSDQDSIRMLEKEVPEGIRSNKHIW
ncbi:hypothetical protein U9M48_001287 [Paspalum notatum var. saurae]|uniref:Uncharacterized protein n=1 Tax=Paspalum notatum var. saurae TaxID=547442 RepID=A0AAQ3PP31_PASNO